MTPVIICQNWKKKIKTRGRAGMVTAGEASESQLSVHQPSALGAEGAATGTASFVGKLLGEHLARGTQTAARRQPPQSR